MPAVHSTKLALASLQQPLVTKPLCERVHDFNLIGIMRNGYRTVFLAGLAAGVADITSAFIVYGLRGSTPIQVLQSVASGWLGMESYEGGLASATLGIFSHFFIAFNAAAVYFVASRKLTFLLRRPLLFGPLYGLAVYTFMSLVVLPLSAFPHKVSFTAEVLARNWLVHMSCVGSPIALITSYGSNQELQPFRSRVEQ